MNIILWILQSLLAVMFIMAGFGKINSTKQQHIADGHIKSGDSVIPIRILGVLEWLGCIGILVPRLTNIFPILTPIAACCFCLIMTAGIVVHTQKKEYKMLPLLTAILTISFVVAYFRFKQLN
jgi:uncharacterized membrane protein YphA (DoxX/SURF4 family)